MSDRDWSSDVCSSDLDGGERRALVASPKFGAEDKGAALTAIARKAKFDPTTVKFLRSEERRVGKEGRPGWPGASVEEKEISVFVAGAPTIQQRARQIV